MLECIGRLFPGCSSSRASAPLESVLREMGGTRRYFTGPGIFRKQNKCLDQRALVSQDGFIFPCANGTIVSKGRIRQRIFSWIDGDSHFTLKFNSVGGDWGENCSRKPGKAPLVSQIKMSLASTRSCWQILKGRPCTQFQLSFENFI